MIVIGKTKEMYKSDEYPSVKTLINKPNKDKKIILEYLKKGTVTSVSPSILIDVIDNKTKINNLCMMNDGKYAWRSDLIYYFEKYDLELQKDFIEYVLNQQ